MNKYDVMSGLSKTEREASRGLANIFREFREIVLNNKDYRLGAARDLLERLSESEAKKIFEMFNYQEGSLTGELEEEYIKLAYSPASLETKMKEGKTFYEALSAIAWEVKNAHLELNPDLVQTQVKLSRQELDKDNLSIEAKQN